MVQRKSQRDTSTAAAAAPPSTRSTNPRLIAITSRITRCFSQSGVGEVEQQVAARGSARRRPADGERRGERRRAARTTSAATAAGTRERAGGERARAA